MRCAATDRRADEGSFGVVQMCVLWAVGYTCQCCAFGHGQHNHARAGALFSHHLRLAGGLSKFLLPFLRFFTLPYAHVYTHHLVYCQPTTTTGKKGEGILKPSRSRYITCPHPRSARLVLRRYARARMPRVRRGAARRPPSSTPISPWSRSYTSHPIARREKGQTF